MIKTDYIKLNIDQRNLLKNGILETRKILDIKYSKRIVILLTFIEFLILYLIYLYEDYGFSIVLKLMTVIPVWFIISITYLYFQKMLPAWKINKLYRSVIKVDKYPAIRINSNHCTGFTDNDIDYYIFDIEQNKVAILRQQDFEVDKIEFPNSDFLVPPINLFEIVGNRILIKGTKINPVRTENKIISRYINAMYMTEKGKILILKKNNNA